LFVVQIGIAFSNELKLPAFVLRSLEARFDASHVKARFGNARFDPAGRVLLENLQLSIPEFGEPVVDVRAVFIELDPRSKHGSPVAQQKKAASVLKERKSREKRRVSHVERSIGEGVLVALSFSVRAAITYAITLGSCASSAALSRDF